MIKRRSRPIVALCVSLGLHAALVFAGVGFAVWRGFSTTVPVEIEFTPVTSEPPRALPLEPMRPPGANPARPRPKPRKVPAAAIAGLGGAPDAGAPPDDAGLPPDASIADAGTGDAGIPGSGDAATPGLRGVGPEGARLHALLRLDRLREVPNAPGAIALVDRILRFLPDRRRLIEGSALDLYKDFDALLIATPNPLDDAVTFLALRHHVADERLQSELQRAAETAGRRLQWRTVNGRPVGTRQNSGAAPGAPPDRDARLFVLPAPGVAVIATPAYAALLLPGALGADAGAAPPSFAALAERLSVDNDVIADDAVFMLTTTGLFSRKKAQAAAQDLAAANPGQPGAALQSLVPPRALDLTLSLIPQPHARAVGTFENAQEAAGWARELPRLKRQMLGNPLVLLSGLTQVLASLDVKQGTAPLDPAAPPPSDPSAIDDEPTVNQVILTVRATRADLERILALVMNLLPQRR